LVPKLVKVLRWEVVAKGLGLSDIPNPETTNIRLLGSGRRAYLCLSSEWPEVFSRCVVLEHDQVGEVRVKYFVTAGDEGVLKTPVGYLNIELTDSGAVLLLFKDINMRVRSSNLALVQFGEFVIALFNDLNSKNRVMLTSPLEGRLIRHNGGFKVVQSATDALILLNDRKGRVRKVYVLNKLLGTISVFELPHCTYVDSECGRELCIVECKDSSYALNTESIHPIPKGLKPLVRCGNAEYYLDTENSLLTVYRDGVLEPLVDERPVDAVCAGDGVLINCSEGVRMLVGNTSIVVNELPAYDIGGSRSSVMYGVNGNYIVVNLETGDKANFNALKCVLLEDDVIWCITRDGLAMLSATEFMRPSIDVVRDRVDSKGYAIVSLRPWLDGCRYRIEGPVDVVASIAAGNALRLTLRPRRLGWCGHVCVILESPIFTLMRKARIVSNEPTLKKLEVLECAYAPEGHLVDDAESNFRALLKVLARWPDPRDPQVILNMSSEGTLRLSRVLSSRRLESDLREFKVLVTGRHLRVGRPLVLAVALGATKESYPVGKASIPLSKYVLRSPFRGSKPPVFKDGNSTVVESVEGASIRVLCGDGKVFEGVGNVRITECLEPAAIKEAVRRGHFEWVRESIIRCDPKVVIEDGSSFSVKLVKRNDGGLLCLEPLLNVPGEHSIKCVLEDIILNGKEGGVADVWISCNASSPSYVFAAAGDSALTNLGWRGTLFRFMLSAPLAKLFLRGVRIYSVALAGRSSVATISGEDLLLRTFYKCCKIAGRLFNIVEAGKVAGSR